MEYNCSVKPKNSKNALVLTGGSIRGAFQAGVISKLFEYGFEPDFISGVSVGALNGGFLWKEINKRSEPDRWFVAGTKLIDFWVYNITKFSDIGKRRNYLLLALDILRNRFKSVLDMSKLEKLVEEMMRYAPYDKHVSFSAGVVDIDSANYEARSSGDHSVEILIKYIIASTKIPILMELKKYFGNHYYDGGLRNIAPLKEAISRGAENIIVVACQPTDMEHLSTANKFNHGNVLDLIDRFTSIMTNEILNNDLAIAEKLNKQVLSGEDSEHRYINIKIYRPKETIMVDLEKFDSTDITDMILSGLRTVDSNPPEESFISKAL